MTCTGKTTKSLIHIKTKRILKKRKTPTAINLATEQSSWCTCKGHTNTNSAPKPTLHGIIQKRRLQRAYDIQRRHHHPPETPVLGFHSGDPHVRPDDASSEESGAHGCHRRLNMVALPLRPRAILLRQTPAT
jgi:hypothetical protein